MATRAEREYKALCDKGHLWLGGDICCCERMRREKCVCSECGTEHYRQVEIKGPKETLTASGARARLKRVA